MDFDTKPASDYPLPDLVEILNRGFDGYFVPIKFNVNTFLNLVRKDGVDLPISRVLLADGEPAGVALLARRGWTSRLAAMGIAQHLRGMGAGSWLMDQIIREACERGEREMCLEVIEQNEAAVHLYQKYGFEIVRRLIGLIRKEAVEEQPRELQEMDVREAARLISQYGLPDLPWQLSAEGIAQMNPPACAYKNQQACIVISNPEADDIVIWSLLVQPNDRGNGLGVETLKAIITQYPMKTWHVPAVLPEELGKIYERARFVREQLSQWQMSLDLKDKK
jgi:ribosomal protein S18 acetylase RimI-like enzyme